MSQWSRIDERHMVHIIYYCHNKYGYISLQCIIVWYCYCAARNILMFDGGRIVKLCDFDSAVVASEARGHRRGFTPYFAAPEVLRGEVARFSADIWSTLCVLVEMLTARMPFCYQEMVKNMEAVFFEVSVKYTSDSLAISILLQVYMKLLLNIW